MPRQAGCEHRRPHAKPPIPERQGKGYQHGYLPSGHGGVGFSGRGGGVGVGVGEGVGVGAGAGSGGVIAILLWSKTSSAHDLPANGGRVRRDRRTSGVDRVCPKGRPSCPPPPCIEADRTCCSYGKECCDDHVFSGWGHFVRSASRTRKVCRVSVWSLPVAAFRASIAK